MAGSPGTKITRSLKQVTTEIKDRKREINSTKSTADSLREARKVSPGNVELTTKYYGALKKQLELSQQQVVKINEAREMLKAKNGDDVTNTAQWKKLNAELEKANANIEQLKVTSNPFGQRFNTSKLEDYFSTAVAGLKKALSFAKSRITQYSETSQSIYNSATKYGQTAEEFQSLSNAYERVTGDANAFTSVMDSAISLQGRISTGNQKVITDLSHIGLTLDDLRGKDASDVLSIITDRRRELGDTADVSSVAIALFGANAGTYVGEMAKTASSTLSQYNAELRENGMLSNEQVANGKKTADSLALLKKKRQEVVASLGEAFSPMIDSLLTALKAIAPIISIAAKGISALGPAGSMAVLGIMPVVSILPKLITQMLALNASTGQWHKVLSTVAILGAVGASLGASIGINASMIQGISGLVSNANYANDVASGSSSSVPNTTNNTKSLTYNDNSVNNYTISKEVDADAVIEEITNKRRTIGG